MSCPNFSIITMSSYLVLYCVCFKKKKKTKTETNKHIWPFLLQHFSKKKNIILFPIYLFFSLILLAKVKKVSPNGQLFYPCISLYYEPKFVYLFFI